MAGTNDIISQNRNFPPANTADKRATPYILKIIPPRRFVLFQTSWLDNVQGVLIPINQFCLARVNNTPI